MNYNFEWDPNKAKSNISFGSKNCNIRIISARKATKKEEEIYNKG